MKQVIEWINFIKKHNWEQDSRRVTTLHRYFDFSESSEIACPKMFGVGVSQEVFIMKNGDISRFSVKDDWDSFVEGLARFFDKPSLVNWARKHMIIDAESFIEWLKNNCRRTSLKKLSDKKLSSILMKRHEKHQMLLSWQWFGFIGKYSIDKKLRDRLQKYSISESEIKMIFSHKRPISIVEEELEAKKIAYQIQQKELEEIDVAKKLNAHLKKFGYIVLYDETNIPMSFEFIQKRVAAYAKNKNLKLEINDTQEKFRKNKKEFKELLSKYKFNKKDLDFIIFSDEFAHFMEIRNNFRAIAAVRSKDLFEIIAEKFGLTIQELLCFTDYEINDALLDNFVLSRQEAKSRHEYSVVATKGVDCLILTGQAAREVGDIIEKKHDLLEFNGSPTNRGVVSGRVKIVVNRKDIGKVEKGDILVSPMTEPVFLMAMKKAAAIVTDEGGALCHAAIISRELNIPCIVGTKIATQVLHDGDLVEVDADRGIVRILNKKHDIR